MWDSIKNFFKIDSFQISPEREEEIIENIAQKISKFGLEFPAVLFGSGYVPVSTMLTQTALLPWAPFLEILGIRGYDYVAFFSKKENTQRLIDRIDELRDAKEKRDALW